MSKKKAFESFNPEQQKKYEEEAANLWGDKFKQSTLAWNNYSDEQKQAILQEGNAIYQDIAAHMDKGPDSPEIQALLVRWHQNLCYFYEPSLEVLEGLGNLYYDHPEFNATFTAIDLALPGFLQKAIAVYVDELETQWLEQELGILKE